MASTTFGRVDYGRMSEKDFQKELETTNLFHQRNKQLQDIKLKYSPANNQEQTSLNSTSATGSGTTGKNLFGGDSSFDNTYNNILDKSKDLARFRLGLDQEQARFSRGLREEESQADFGRNYKLADQQISGTQRLQQMIQDATTGRQRQQLDSQQLMQQKGFDQQNAFRAQSAFLASRGLK